ncbi:hypothetical protein QJS04_geneDACA012038 [Acorus gramineus]|uniref:PPIase cyclophilin-type domain-containing protein n=1 Tax=Acorus gramineus TaxID=55184 RepID=A0AAV9BD47_ACOGR|nr:hypothetical protein QJS04_geneDACA012038 [Acorus gramineus]
MGRSQTGSGCTGLSLLGLLLAALVSSSLVSSMTLGSVEESCCRGVENLEIWGKAVKGGNDLKFNSSKECCEVCKTMCDGGDGDCQCDSWVFCGDRERCKERFGECLLKKQKDVLFPALQVSGDEVIWTSGLIFGEGEGIVSMETEYGSLRIKSPLGPPFAFIQGTLEAAGVTFNNLPPEACPPIRAGSVAWIGSGPEFFISLANHDEWTTRAYTVFGSVLPEDMDIVEKIARLPTKPDLWNNVIVSALEKPARIWLRRISKTRQDQ